MDILKIVRGRRIYLDGRAYPFTEQMHLLAFGNPVYNFIHTPWVETSERILSGCSTNACLAMSRLGNRATLVGSVGADYEERLVDYLTRCEVKFWLQPSRETGGFSLVYDERGNRRLRILGIADPISPLTAHKGLGYALNGGETVDVVLLGPVLGETGIELVQAIRREIHAPILLDPQGVLREAVGDRVVYTRTKAFEEIAPFCTVIKANEVEAEVVTGINARQNPEAAVRELHTWGCEIAIVTLAELGSIIFDGAVVYKIPAYKVVAVDPTGAGDAYAAGFMHYTARAWSESKRANGALSLNMYEVGCFASAVASVKVEQSGPDFALDFFSTLLRVEAENCAITACNLGTLLSRYCTTR